LAHDGGDLDLHHFSNALNRLVGDDDGLWSRAGIVKWRGFDIHVPGPSDALVLGIVHGLRWSPECNADWIIDVASYMDTGQIDWDLVLKEGARREVQAILFTGLTYLRDAIGRDVPQAVTDTLMAQATELQWAELASYAAVPMPRTPEQNKPMLAMAVQRASGGPPGRSGGERGLLRLTAKALPHRSLVPLSPEALESDVTHLTVRLTDLPQTQPWLTATLCILGIVLNRGPGIPGKSEAEGAYQDFSFSISTRLLRRRGAQNLCLTIAPVEKPVYPPWRH
jgi:hypothetical protein